MPAAAIKQTAAPRTPAREGLAVAISRVDNAKRTAAALDKAIEAAAVKYFDLVSEVDAAEKAAATAHDDQAEFLVATALGSAGEPPLSPKAVREALEALRDERDTARSVWKSLEALTDDRASAIARGERLLDEAVTNVIKSDAGLISLFDEAERLYSELTGLQAVLGNRHLMGKLPREPNWFRVPPRDTSSDAEWTAALAALRVNVDAKLPV